MDVSADFRSAATTLSSTDACARFMRSLAALWVHRILERYPALDRQTLEFVDWVLPREEGRLFDILSIDACSGKSDVNPRRASHSDSITAICDRIGSPQSAQYGVALKSIQKRLGAVASHIPPQGEVEAYRDVVNTFALTDDECRVAVFLACISAWNHASDYFDSHLECDRPTGRKYLLAALDMSQERMRAVLAGKLSRIGILDTKGSWISISGEYVQLFADPSAPVDHDHLYRPVPSPDIGLNCLNVPSEALSLLRDLLSSAGNKPAHVLLWGPPGTGKTTLARGLANESVSGALEVAGQQVGSISARRGAIEACWNIAESMPGSIVVVDEADHVLGTSGGWSSRGDAADKAWLNDLLERPSIRCIWIVNETGEIEPAVMRRFSYSLKVEAPGVKERAHALDGLLRRHRIKRHFSSDLIRRIAQDYSVSPGVFDSAARTASLIGGNPADCRSGFKAALDASVELTSGRKPRQRRNRTEFISDGINTDVSLDRLESLVATFRRRLELAHDSELRAPFCLLFHGQPGTGKSLTGSHLADRLDRTVVRVRASQLLGPFVGETERRIANAFSSAREERSVLVIDEVDSLLGQRGAAHRQWEVTLVNEMLTQMEEPGTILIGTTNRLNQIDAAAVRRFALSVRFDPLRREQVVSVARQVWGPCCNRCSKRGQWDALESFNGVTVADLVRVRDQLAVTRGTGADLSEFVVELERSLGSRNRGGLERQIGFH